MTIDDWVSLSALRVLARLEPVQISRLIPAIQGELVACGWERHIAGKLDNVAVGQMLIGWQRDEPPLVQGAWDPRDEIGHGNIRSGAEQYWNLTTYGEAEMDRLERLTEAQWL